MDRFEAIKRDAFWVLQFYGTDTMGAAFRHKMQAERIAEFARQWDMADGLLNSRGLDLINIVPVHEVEMPPAMPWELAEESKKKED